MIYRVNQDDALKTLQRGGNYFVTGAAGTGKSWLLQRFREQCLRPAIVTSSTGVSALNIDGVTLHSFFGLGVLPPEVQVGPPLMDWVARHCSLKKLFTKLSGYDVLVVDEVSMLLAQHLDAVDYLCKLAAKSQRPFGGMQVVFFGDLLQLPPVVKNNAAIPWCYQSRSWEEARIKILALNEVKRQTDAPFIQALKLMRWGQVKPDTDWLIRQREGVEGGEDVIELASRNADVDQINAHRLQQLPTQERNYRAQLTGETKAMQELRRQVLSPEELPLKVGARVMATRNIEDVPCVNGSLGTVFQLAPGWVRVRFDGGTGVSEVSTAEWKHLDPYTGLTLATFSQIPLRLAWAVSIHKSQGLTFDKVKINLSHVFCPGQAYVAISRARSLQGVFLRGWNPRRVFAEKNVVNWLKSLPVQDGPPAMPAPAGVA